MTASAGNPTQISRSRVSTLKHWNNPESSVYITVYRVLRHIKFGLGSLNARMMRCSMACGDGILLTGFTKSVLIRSHYLIKTTKGATHLVGNSPQFSIFFSCKKELNWKNVCILVARSKHIIGVESESDSLTLKWKLYSTECKIIYEIRLFMVLDFLEYILYYTKLCKYIM